MFDQSIMKSVKISIALFCNENWNNYNWDLNKLSPHIPHFSNVWIKEKMRRFIDPDFVTEEQIAFLKLMVSNRFTEVYFSNKKHHNCDLIYIDKYKDNIAYDHNELIYYGYNEYLLRELKSKKSAQSLLRSGQLSVSGFIGYSANSDYSSAKYYFAFTHYNWGLKDKSIYIQIHDDDLYHKINASYGTYATLTISIRQTSNGKIYYTLNSLDAINEKPFWAYF